MKIIGSTLWRSLARVIIAGLFAASPAAVAQSAPSLGQAEGFSVLGGSAVTNTGATVIVGDLGIWPNTASSITGFPPGSVIGTVHAGDAVAQQAQSDLTTAYNDLAGRACDTDLSGTDLGGLTLTPGVYCFTTSAQLTGTLTLDALGDPDAVFVFKIGTTLTTATGSSVGTINGGSGCNIFWQLGSSATLGTGTAFEGNILALTSITLVSGASVSGRVLARNGAVTLDTNSVGGCIADACPVLDLTPTTLPQGILGEAYSATVAASGGTAPYTYSVTAGAPPTGLTLDALSGELSGTPSALGSFSFTITAVDAEGCERSRVYTIVIGAAACPAVLLLDPPSLPAILLGQPYSQFIMASGGTAPYVYGVTAGVLPLGLVLAAGTGELSGTPPIVGSFGFTVTATDADGCVGSQAYTLVIGAPGCPAIVIAPLVLPVMLSGIPYSQTFTGSGGTAPYTFGLTGGALPPGLSLNPLSGVLSGIPTATGGFSFVVTVTDAVGCSSSAAFDAQVAATAAPLTIPALPPWGLLLLAGGLGLLGLVALRR